MLRLQPSTPSRPRTGIPAHLRVAALAVAVFVAGCDQKGTVTDTLGTIQDRDLSALAVVLCNCAAPASASEQSSRQGGWSHV